MIATIRKWLAAAIGVSGQAGPTRTKRRNVRRATQRFSQETEKSVACWIADTWKRSEQIQPGKDGRLRLRSEASLDVCVSPAMLSAAIGAFAGWIEALRLQDICVEARSPDGWRVCAVRDQVALAIRVRERLQRVATLRGASRLVERLLGGGDEAALIPSRQLELQIMRHGISIAAIVYRPEAPEECYESAMEAMQQLWVQEQRHLRRLRELAEARNAPPKRRYGMQPSAVRHEVPAPVHHGATAPSPLQEARQQAMASVDHTQRAVMEAFQQLENALLAAPDHLRHSESMTASLATLSASCKSNRPADTAEGLFGVASRTGRLIRVRSKRSLTERVVA